jgi:peroxiredoxin
MDGYTASKRAVVVVDKGGVIRFKWIGPNPGVEPDYDEVKQLISGL